MNDIELLNFVKEELRKAIKDEICEVLEQDETKVCVYDEDYEREFCLYKPTAMTADWLKNKIVITQSAKDCGFCPDAEVLANWLIANFGKEYYLNLNKIVFSFDEDADYDELCQNEDFEEMFDAGHYFPCEECLGIYWNEYDTVVISIQNILASCREIETKDDMYFDMSKEMNIGIMTTLLHELGHLGQNNPYTPDIASEEGKEEEVVEALAIEAYDRNPQYVLIA